MNVKKIAVVCIIVAGLILRFFQFTTIPPLHWDEMFFGYSAYSILKTGADEHNQFLPLILTSIGDYKLAPFAYTLIPSVAIFGLNAFAMRFIAQIIGLLTLLYTYKLVKSLTSNPQLALVSTIVLAFSPWHLIFSRTANESILQLLFFLTTFYYWREYGKSHKKSALIFSSISGAFAIWTYYSSFVFLPLAGLAYIVLTKSYKKFSSLVPLVILSIALITFVLTQPLDRINQTSIFAHQTPQALLFEAHQEQGISGNVLITRLLYNKATLASFVIVTNYFQHLTADFLYLNGDEHPARYSIPYIGPLFIWTLPFLCLGLLSAFSKRSIDLRPNLFMATWFLISFLPGALSFEGTNVQRSLMAVIPYSYITAIGLLSTYSFLQTISMKQRVAGLTLISILFLINFVYFLNSYFIRQLVHQPYHRQPHIAETYKALDELSKSYDQVVIGNVPYAELFFHYKTDPVKAQKLLKTESRTLDTRIFIKRYDKFEIMPVNCPDEGKLGVLYLCNGDEVPYNSKIIKVIRYANDVPSRVFLEFTPPDVVTPQAGNRIRILKSTQAQPKIIPTTESRNW